MSVAEAERQALALLGPDPDDEEGEELELVDAPEPATDDEPPADTPDQPDQPDKPDEQPPVVDAAPDIWAETADVEYTDEDTGEKYMVRAPKSYADKVKGGYARRSIMDRKLGAYQRNREWLDPLAEDGRLDKLSPYLQQIFSDNDIQNAMVEVFARRQSGKPLKFSDDAIAQAAAAGAAAPPQPAAPQQVNVEAELQRIQRENGYDEYTMEVVRNSFAPMQAAITAQMRGMQEQYQPFIEAQRTQQAQAAEGQRRQQWMQQQAAQTRSELISRWPEVYEKGGNDVWDRVEKYARDAGLLDRYGMQPLTFVEAHQRMTRDETQNRAPSAAATVAQIDAQARRLASQAAQQAGGVSVNSGAPQSQPPATTTRAPSVSTEAVRPSASQSSRHIEQGSGAKRPLTPLEIAEYTRRQSGGN
ncbi:MAG: hypothetical protein NVS1B14_10050 [Vulcanimicrobiaceae bacterium]